MSKDENDFNLALVILLVIFLIFVFSLALFCSHIDRNHMDSLYNNGICLKCGGNYNFFTVVGHNSALYYVYMCDNCKNIVEMKDYR